MKITKTLAAALIAAVALFTAATAEAQVGSKVPAEIIHGDADANGALDIADVQTMLAILFEGKNPFVSKRALDHNGDGKFDLADVDSAIRDLQERGPRRGTPVKEDVIVGDANDDGKVNVADLAALAGWLTGGRHFGAPTEGADLNKDRRVDITDLTILAESLGG